MRIRIKTHGHQHYQVSEGEVVQWCSSVEHYSHENKSIPLQVPAVLLNTGLEVLLVPLQRDLQWTEIEVLGKDGEHAPSCQSLKFIPGADIQLVCDCWLSLESSERPYG